MASMNLPTHVIPPAHGQAHTHTVVFLHGRGDNADNFSRSLYQWRGSDKRNLFDVYPTFRWVFPQAPLRACASSPSSTVMPQWFDVWNTADFSDNEQVQAEGLREVVPAVEALIANEAAALGGDTSRIVLAGISMGAATSIHTLFHLDGARLGAFLGFSCRCPFAGRSLPELRGLLGIPGAPNDNSFLRNTPIMLEHCADDPLVKVADGRRNRDILASFGAGVEWREYPDGGHWLRSPEGVDDLVVFLNHVLGGGSAKATQGDAMDMS